MKKFVAFFLMLALCFTAMVGCAAENNQQTDAEVPEAPTAAPEPTEEPVPEVDPLDNAKSYIHLMYKNDAVKTPADYKVVGVVVVNDVTYDIAWSVAIAEGGEADAVVVGEMDENKQVTIDINELCAAETAYTLVGSISDGSKAVEVSFEHIVPQGFDLTTASYDELVDAAYELEDGAALEGTVRLFGTVVNIDTPWSDEYQNITVTIAVAGLEDKPVQCYRLSGEGANTLEVGEAITVEGTIKNYKGTIEFDKGCVLVGYGEIISQAATLDAAYALDDGAALSKPSVLKGVVSSIDTEWSDEYQNITVTIVCDGKTEQPIQCYRLTGEGAKDLAVGAEIAVFGTIKNYKGTIEFDKGCVLVPVDSIASVKAVIAGYALAEGGAMTSESTITGTVVAIPTAWSDEYQNITVNMVVAGLEDYVIQCYRLTGEGAKDLAEGDVITVTGILKNYKGTVEFDKGCTLN